MSAGVNETLFDIVADVQNTRWLTLAGLTVLVYNTLISLDEEVTLIWGSKGNFLKWGFLVNKYVAIVATLVAQFALGVVQGMVFSKTFCQMWILITNIVVIFSITVENVLYLFRVATLWEKRRNILIILLTLLVFSTIGSLLVLIRAAVLLLPFMQYIPLLQMCALDYHQSAHFFVITWGLPLAFDLVLVVLTILNALHRPRLAQETLVDLLREDGVHYLIAVTSIRIVNLVFFSTQRTSRLFFLAHLTWALILSLTNNYLLRIRRNKRGGTLFDEEEEHEDIDKENQVDHLLLVPLGCDNSTCIRESKISASSVSEEGLNRNSFIEM